MLVLDKTGRVMRPVLEQVAALDSIRGDKFQLRAMTPVGVSKSHDAAVSLDP